MRISDWSSDVCSSDLVQTQIRGLLVRRGDVTTANAGAREDPLISGVDPAFELHVAQGLCGQIAAGADNTGIRHRSLAGGIGAIRRRPDAHFSAITKKPRQASAWRVREPTCLRGHRPLASPCRRLRTPAVAARSAET